MYISGKNKILNSVPCLHSRSGLLFFFVLTEVETHSFPGDKSTPGIGLQQILTAKQSNGCSHGSVQDLNICLGHCLDSPGMTVPWVTVEFDGRHYFLEHLM